MLSFSTPKYHGYTNKKIGICKYNYLHIKVWVKERDFKMKSTEQSTPPIKNLSLKTNSSNMKLDDRDFAITKNSPFENSFGGGGIIEFILP